LQWYNDTSEKWSKKADDLLKQSEILESMGGFLKDYARSYGELRSASEVGLKNLRLPARSDIARVAKLVRTVEDKVDQIQEVFEEFIYTDAEPATAAAVGGLEERMDRLEGKMDQMLAILEKLGADNGHNSPESSRRSTVEEEYEDKTSTPLEGLSLSLIEAGHVGGAGGRGVMEGPKPKEER
jgi:DNA repair exonuclease SbcCD ATPase subunit